MRMRNIFIIGFLFFAVGVSAQWIDPWQIRPAPDSNMVLGSLGQWNDAAWIYRDSLLKGLVVRGDSIFLRNDTILLRDGQGFVKVTFDSLNNRGLLSLSNDTLYYKPCATCAVWFGKLPAGGGGGSENTTDELQDLFPHSTGFILSHPTPTLQDTVIFQYTGGVVTTPPTGCQCTIPDIPTLSDQLAAKANAAHLHSIAEVTGLLGALDGKEAAFTKGSLVAGTNVTLSGTLTNRLVGSGDVTINATGGGVQAFEVVNGSNIAFIFDNLLNISLAAGTYKIDAICRIVNNETYISDIMITLKNTTTNTTYFESNNNTAGLSNVTLFASRLVTLTGTNNIRLEGSSTGIATALANRCMIQALKIN